VTPIMKLLVAVETLMGRHRKVHRGDFEGAGADAEHAGYHAGDVHQGKATRVWETR